MGTVYLAQQTEPVRRLVAVKLVKPGMDGGQVLARFEAERQALALMDHPKIARVLDAGATPEGRPYFVMELVDDLVEGARGAGPVVGIAVVDGLDAVRAGGQRRDREGCRGHAVDDDDRRGTQQHRAVVELHGAGGGTVGAETVAVKVTGWPVADGLAEEASVVVVISGSPRKRAVANWE
jgi:hypothetical protein